MSAFGFYIHAVDPFRDIQFLYYFPVKEFIYPAWRFKCEGQVQYFM